MNTRRHPALAWTATSVLGIGLALTTLPADAAAPAHTGGHAATSTLGATTTPRRTPDTDRRSTERLTPDQLAHVRARQAHLLAHHRPAPTLADAKARTPARTATKTRRLTVTTTEDSDLANPTGTRCIDAATGACSLRAAIDTANNRRTPTKIILAKHRYTLTTGQQLTVTNPAGTSLVGRGARHTTIAANGSRVIEETQSSTSASRPLLLLRDLKITGGAADTGAGVNLDADLAGATLRLDGVVISDNTATVIGGGIHSLSGATIYATDSTITRNTAPEAAGLYTYWSDVHLTDVSIVDNHTTTGQRGSGGGWENEYGVARMEGGSISGNSAGEGTFFGEGGGLFDRFGNVALTDVHVDHNTIGGGGDGGGIEASQDLLQLRGGSLSHNRASGVDPKGGGLYVWRGAQVGLHGVDLVGNRVTPSQTDTFGGGAIFLDLLGFDNQISIDSGTRIKGSNGSAIYVVAANGQANLDIDHTRLAHNTNTSSITADGVPCGGAICAVSLARAAVNLTMNGNSLVDNTTTAAPPEGAGAVLVSGSFLSELRVHLLHNLFRDNASGAAGLGGAVGVVSMSAASASLRSESNTFIHNRTGTSGAAGRGGAIGVEGTALVTDSRSTFRHNRAIGDGAYGGAVYNNGSESTRFVGSVFAANSSGPAHGGDGHGGAVFTDDQGGTTFTGVTMTGNRTATFGGAIDTSDSSLDVMVERSTIAGNHAGNTGTNGYGGGIYAANAVLTVENSTIGGNRAHGTDGVGGGIYSAGSTLGIRYSTVTRNIARHGGGLAIDTLGGTLLGSIVTGNHLPAGAVEDDCVAHGGPATLHSLGGNLLGQRGCVTATSRSDKLTRHPRLTKLRDNGGPTRTMALTPRSPAIGRGTYLCPSTDQRGRHRPARRCDAGAFELPKAKEHHHHHHP